MYISQVLSLLSRSKLVDRLVDNLEDFAHPVEPIPVFLDEFFGILAFSRCPISRLAILTVHRAVLTGVCEPAHNTRYCRLIPTIFVRALSTGGYGSGPRQPALQQTGPQCGW